MPSACFLHFEQVSIITAVCCFAGPRLGRAFSLRVCGDSQVRHRIRCEPGLPAVRREHQDDRNIYSLLLPCEPGRNRAGHHFTPYQ